MTRYVLGGGCFWCLDAIYRRIKGVISVESGYVGGDKKPTYYQVATGTTNHAEVVRVTFDETVIPPKTILDLFFLIHDPTTLNRQGADIGSQYRSIMFYENDEQKDTYIEAINRARSIWQGTIVTEVAPLKEFFIAEPEHQDYFNKNPAAGYCSIVISPKISKARQAFAPWFKEESL